MPAWPPRRAALEAVDRRAHLVNLGTVRVSDRRRFHPDGAPREGTPEAPDSRAPEPAAEAAPLPEAVPELDQLRAELVAARARINELARGLQEAVRERAAFQDRITRENERHREVEKGEFALPVIEAIDALELSLQADDGSPLARGVRLIRDDLLAKLAARGIERLHLVGAPFDPHQAEAVDTELAPHPAQDGRVLSEVRAGYVLGGRVVRPARVRVGRYVEPAQA
jgi:molecular chaperone GrpE